MYYYLKMLYSKIKDYNSYFVDNKVTINIINYIKKINKINMNLKII